MKIMPIAQYQSGTNFRGLAIDGSVNNIDDTHYDSGLKEYVGEKRTMKIIKYYPFLEESEAEIEEAVKKLSERKVDNNNFLKYIYVNLVKRMERLPFTKIECETFMKEFNVSKLDFIKNYEFFKLMSGYMKNLK